MRGDSQVRLGGRRRGNHRMKELGAVQSERPAACRAVPSSAGSHKQPPPPTTAGRSPRCCPPPLGTLDTAAPEPMATFTRSGYFTPFTPVFNASGQPGISLPLFHGSDGLPRAVQLVDRRD